MSSQTTSSFSSSQLLAPLANIVVLILSITTAFFCTYYASQTTIRPFTVFFLTSTSGFVVYLILSVVNNFYIYPQYTSPLRHIPTVKQVPVHQRLFTEIRGKAARVFFDQSLSDAGKKKKRDDDGVNQEGDSSGAGGGGRGLVRAFTTLNTEVLIATQPEVVKEILVQGGGYGWMKPPAMSRILEMLIGRGLVTMEGTEHRHHRRLLQSAFNYRQIQDLYPTFWEKTTELVTCMGDEIGKKGSDGVVDIQDWMQRATMDVIGTAGFGFEFRAVSDPESELVRNYRRMFESEPSPVADLLLRTLPVMSLLKMMPVQRIKDIEASTGAIRTQLKIIIDQRRKILKGSGGEKRTLSEKDILSVAMQGDEEYSDEQLMGHSMTFLAAGQDTTAFALTCAILELSQHLDVQEQLRKEIRAHLPSLDSQDSISTGATNVDGLPWLTAVCNETLRFHPSVDKSSRVNLPNDAVLAGYKVPKGTLVDIPVQAFNTHQPLWSDSPWDVLGWHPERWFDDVSAGKLNSSGGAADAYSFMTFMRGARSCIGERFARTEMAILLAGMVGRFEFEFHGASGKGRPIELLDVSYGFTGHVNDGVFVTVKEVAGW